MNVEAESRQALIERLTERLVSGTGVKAVFGEPVERAGTTVIPVAKVRIGFGGGHGSKGSEERGWGGGGGVRSTPLGYIELRDGTAEFRPVRDPASWAPVTAVTGLVTVLVLRALRRRH